MNDKFFELSQEKQLAIINAGFMVFGQFDYKKASTELMAQKAGISKGLLFYYFHNKLEFFQYLYTYAVNLMRETVEQSDYIKTTDFFVALEIITKKKCSLLKSSPYIMNFIVSASYSKEEKVQEVVKGITDSNAEKALKSKLSSIDYSEFREDVNPKDILEILSFSLDGYLQHKLRNGESMDIDDIMQKYKVWTHILKLSISK